MTRLTEITTREELPEDARPIFDAIAGARNGRVGFPFTFLLHSPQVAGRIAHLGTYIRFESQLSQNDREIATLVAARNSDCAFEWGSHCRVALGLGIAQETLDVIGHWRPTDGLAEDEALIVDYGRAVLKDHRVPDELYDRALAHFGAQSLVDLTMLMAYYTMMAAALNTFQIEPAEGSAPLP